MGGGKGTVPEHATERWRTANAAHRAIAYGPRRAGVGGERVTFRDQTT